MKTIFAIMFAFVMTVAPTKKAEASDITTSVVVGVLVAHYAGALAGVAVSSVSAGTAILLGAGKEAAVKAAQNDIQSFYSTGVLSLSLENTINSIKVLDESVSDEEALDMILVALEQ